jgi:hypothetical protein
MDIVDVLALPHWRKYRVKYQIEGIHRVPREGVATFMGLTGISQALMFSGRPQFGTTELDLKHITSMEPVDDDTDCYMDRKVS